MENVSLEITGTGDQAALICTSYWERTSNGEFLHTVSSLADQFGMTAYAFGKFAAENSAVNLIDRRCIVCDGCQQSTSRSDFQRISRTIPQPFTCSSCKAEQARMLELEKKSLDEQRLNAIRTHYALAEGVNFEISDHSLESVVYLLSFFRVAASETLTALKSFDSLTVPLAPTEVYSLDILRMLYNRRLIAVHPGNLRLTAFDFSTGTPDSFYLDKVWWTLPYAQTSQSVTETILEIERIFREIDWPTHWLDEITGVWQKLALNECIEYLELSLEEHHLPFTVGDKTRLTFSTILETYSVSQVYCMIWKAAREAAAYYQRGGITKQHAANSTVGSIQRYADSARGGGWDVPKYRRDRRLPQTMVSQVFFNTVLHSEDGFDRPILLNRIEQITD